MYVWKLFTRLRHWSGIVGTKSVPFGDNATTGRSHIKVFCSMKKITFVWF